MLSCGGVLWRNHVAAPDIHDPMSWQTDPTKPRSTCCQLKLIIYNDVEIEELTWLHVDIILNITWNLIWHDKHDDDVYNCVVTWIILTLSCSHDSEAIMRNFTIFTTLSPLFTFNINFWLISWLQGNNQSLIESV